MNIKKYIAGQKWGEDISRLKIKSKKRNKYNDLIRAKKTCDKYAKNKKIIQTRDGIFISKGDRDFYRGASYGISLILKQKF